MNWDTGRNEIKPSLAGSFGAVPATSPPMPTADARMRSKFNMPTSRPSRPPAPKPEPATVALVQPRERKLTRRQNQVLDYIKEVVYSKGYPPSIREIGAAVDLSSSSTVHTHLKTLEARGFIRRNPSKPRSIELTEPGHKPGVKVVFSMGQAQKLLSLVVDDPDFEAIRGDLAGYVERAS